MSQVTQVRLIMTHGCGSIRGHLSAAEGEAPCGRTSQHASGRRRRFPRQRSDRTAHRVDLLHIEIRLPRHLLLPTGSL